MKNKILILFIIVLASVLRLIALDTHPIGLNADEAAIGYNAYSLIQTGKDEHNTSWPLVFRSFDDFKPPIYFYLVLPFVKLLGLTVLAVRLPSAILGIATVYLLYLLSNQLLYKKLLDSKYLTISTGDLAAFLLAISPWHIHFSRGGWEVNAATFFLVLGLWAFYKGLKQPKFLFLWVFSFVVSLYTYHSIRVVAPLLGLYLLIAHFQDLRKTTHLRTFVYSIVMGVVLIIPLTIQLLSSSGQARFAGVSIFADQGPVLQANVLRGEHQDPQGLAPKLLHNRYLYYGLRFFNNYTKHFSPTFLFLDGDEIARSKVPNMGQSYLWTLPFFAFGLWYFAKNKNRRIGLVVAWILVGVIPASLTFQSPHALRAQNISVPLQIIVAFGMYQTYLWIKQIKFIKTIIITSLAILLITIVFSVSRYTHLYYVHYPKEYGFAWQPGFSQLADYLNNNDSEYDQVIISTRYDQPYILLAFFLKYPPAKLQQELVFSTPDNFGFSTGLEFGKYHFRPIDYKADEKNKNTLLVVADEPVESQAKLVHTIYYPNGDPVFRIYSTKK